MAKWINDGSVLCKEVHSYRTEQYNSISGSPIFRTRLEVPYAQTSLALSKLVGIPEIWPHSTIFQNVRCIEANVVSDQGAYTTDGDGLILIPENQSLIDVTYAPRHGFYHEDYNGKDVYWDDTLEPRIEYRPMVHSQIIWENLDGTIPTNPAPINPDDVPSRFQGGETLTHTIEGWALGALETLLVSDHIGTICAESYTSIPLNNRVFPAQTLLLKNIIEVKSYSFISYRQAPEPFSGKPTLTLKFIYEYKKEGWNKFWRLDVQNNTEGYSRLRHINAPHNLIIPFPVATHQIWMGT